MNSSWDQTQAHSSYHFDAQRVDNKNDVLIELGHVAATWHNDLTDIIARSQPATWATRGYKAQGVGIPRPDLAAEEYDLERVGADPKMTITNLDWELPASLQQLTDAFALEDCMNRIHVQMPGQVWNRHIDKLNKWCPEDPSRVGRYFVQLTDWQPGQFWEYGNYHWQHWRAGDVSTFDWANMPHCTANAGHHPRVTFQLTGVITAKTIEFINTLKINEQVSR